MKRSTLFFGAAFGAAAMLAGCVGAKAPAEGGDPLRQGWEFPKDVVSWYESSQGSRLIPLAWLTELRQPGSSKPFLDDAFIRTFRYEPRDVAHPDKPGQKLRLPRGFAIDQSSDNDYSEAQTKLRWRQKQGNESWVGMTCAACHTAEITYKGTAWTVQGGPTLADFQTFIRQLDKALGETYSDADRFDAFAKAVLTAGTAETGKDAINGDNAVNRDLLRKALKVRIDWVGNLEKLNNTDLLYGFGRLDAVGNILNKVALVAGSPDISPNPADAPVSYPFLWNVPQHDKVQWNGMAKNKVLGSGGLDVGALGRNAGEVIGVFADIEVTKSPGFNGYASSVHVDNLDRLENMLKRLKPPAWPAKEFGEPKPVVVVDGKTYDGKVLFVTKGCAGCHAVLDREDLDTPIVARMVRFKSEKPGEPSIDTDPWMACNAYSFVSATGKMAGQKRLGEAPVKDYEKLADMLPVVITEALLHKKREVVDIAVRGFFGIERLPTPPLAAAAPAPGSLKDRRKAACLDTSHEILAYKARPLNGIWATAPYLHNGSVPTLMELLQPPGVRKKDFYVGSKEYDPENVGFIAGYTPDNSFRFDTKLEGNSNAGHDYGVGNLSPPEREALLEYMKTL